MTREEAIIYLKDAKYDLPYKFEQTLEMAIEALSEDTKGYSTMSEEYDKAIESLSADADRPSGEWVEQYASKERTAKLAVCSECGWYDGYKANNYNFCPNCGARMRGDVE